MSIKTATRIAICGVAVGTIMSLVQPYLYKLLTDGMGFSFTAAGNFIAAYFNLRTIFCEGGILLFLLVLHSKQKE